MRTPVLDRLVPLAMNQASPWSGTAAASVRTRLQDRWDKRLGRKVTLAAVYEDFLTGTRVTEFSRGLAKDLNSRQELGRQMWLLNLLRLPQLRAIAAHEAASADLIVVCFHDAESFPVEIKDWAEAWLEEKKDRPIALLGLFDELCGRVPSALETYLENVARRGGMGFFLWVSELAPERQA